MQQAFSLPLVFFLSFSWIDQTSAARCSRAELQQVRSLARSERDYIVANLKKEDLSLNVAKFQRLIERCDIPLSSFGLRRGVFQFWKAESEKVKAKAEADAKAESNTKVICPQTTGKTALVVIDMQSFFVTRGGNDKEPTNMVKVSTINTKIKDAIKLARKHDFPIIFIEYEGQGSTNQLLLDEAKDYKNVRVFQKDTDGMFDKSNRWRGHLISYLKGKGIDTLIITGANGGACVKKSILGSLNGNCNIIAYNKGIADFNFEEFIYPYENRLENIQDQCENCKVQQNDGQSQFREIDRFSSLGDVNSGSLEYSPSPQKIEGGSQ